MHGASAIVLAGALAAWLITGREGYTRWPDEKLARSDAPPSQAEEELLGDVGFETEADRAAQVDVQSRFAFGLVPGGLDLLHLPSIASAGALAVALSASAVLWRALRSRVDERRFPSSPSSGGSRP
jgi:hypothetical protein